MRPLAAGLVLLVARAALADEPGRSLVDVAIDPCIDVRASEVKRIAAIELGASGEALLTETVDVRAGCKGALVEISVDDPITRKSLTRSIDLARSPPAGRARLLALAIAELVSASWSELDSNPDPRAEPAGPPPSTAARELARSRARAFERPPTGGRLRIEAVGGLRGFNSGVSVMWGGGGRIAQDFEWVGWWVDLFAADGAAPLAIVGQPQAHVDVQTYTISAGAAVRRGWSRVAARLGVGVCGGAAVFRSTEVDPTTFSARPAQAAPWFGVLAMASASIAATRSLAVELAIEGGYVVSPARALLDNNPSKVLAQIAGEWVGLSLGVGFFP